jgi:hypothetical protein
VTSARLAERLLASIDWSSLRSLDGDGRGVQRALGDLLAAESPAAAERAHWGIENHAVAQGELFEVAEACSSVLIAALADPREQWVRVAVLELLFQVLAGYAYASKSPGTPADVVQRCRDVVREGLWLLVREAMCGVREGALDVLDLLGEGQRARRLLSA